MPIIEISSLTHPGVDVFCMLTEAQLRQRMEPGKGVFIAESPNVEYFVVYSRILMSMV